MKDITMDVYLKVQSFDYVRIHMHKHIESHCITLQESVHGKLCPCNLTKDL